MKFALKAVFAATLYAGAGGCGDNTPADPSKAPNVLYLFYGDGQTELAKTSPDACAGKGPPPAFKCSFTPFTEDACKDAFEANLKNLLSDFNVVVTRERPTSGKFYTEVISSGGGAWCGQDPIKVAGIAPFICNDLGGGVAYVFQGETAKKMAVAGAQEFAHLVGLDHTTDRKDVMYPQLSVSATGFVNNDTPISGPDHCGRGTQNSHAMMQDRLGLEPAIAPEPVPVTSALTAQTSQAVRPMEIRVLTNP